MVTETPWQRELREAICRKHADLLMAKLDRDWRRSIVLHVEIVVLQRELERPLYITDVC